MGISEWLGFGDTAKGIGEGISTATQGIRHLITGDVSPDMVVKLQEVEIELAKVHARIVESDNSAGWLNRSIRPMTFAITFTTWVMLLIVRAFTDVEFDDFIIKELSAFLYILVPSFFLYRTYEKVKGVAT